MSITRHTSNAAFTMLAFLAGCSYHSPTPPQASQALDSLPLNHTQFIGTHNSYKLESDDGIDDVMRFEGYREDERFDAAALKYRLAYQHLPLTTQLDLGIRAFELDVHADPTGGRYAHPGGHAAMAAFNLQPNTPYDPEGVMNSPGFKVFHVPDWDFRSSCLTLQSCLEEIGIWADEHPSHFPIFIRVEFKQKTMPPIGTHYEPANVPTATAELFRDLQSEVLRAFQPRQLFTPHAFTGTWPTVAELRGKIIFLLSGRQTLATLYGEAVGPDSERLMFTFFEPLGGARFTTLSGEQLDAASLLPPDTLAFARTETYDTREARNNDTTQRDRAFASPANILFTDFPTPDPRFSRYNVRFNNRSYTRPHPLTKDE